MLDLRTLVLAAFVCSVGFMVSMWLLRKVLPGEPGLRYWSHGALYMTLGIYLQSTREWAPAVLAIHAGNALVVTGLFGCALGVLSMSGRVVRARWMWGTFAVSLALMGLVEFLPNAPYWRLIVQSALMAAAMASMTWMFWRYPNPRLQRVSRATAAVFGLGCSLFVARMVFARPETVALPLQAIQSWEFLLPYAYAILFLNWTSIAVSVLAGDQIMEQLRQALNKAEESDRMKSAFLASITHEWRTPLNAISGFSQMLRQEQPSADTVRQSAELIQTAGAQMLETVNNLMDLRLLQDGGMEFHFDLTHIQPLIDQALATERDAALRMNVRLSLTGAAANPAVWVDAQRLRQVLGNLVSNAIRFNRTNGRVDVMWEADGHSVIVRVRDDGPGIPFDLQHRLFKPFDRLGAESGTVHGTGIGLAISQQLVQRMGGSIGFHSQPGVGSEFWVRFPRAERVKGEVVLQTPLGQSHGDSQSTLPQIPVEPAIPQRQRVLYIEDNPTNQKLVQAVFQKQLGITVDLAITAEEGLACAIAQRPGLILLDINLPGMDGYQALKALRADERTRTIPVMALTAQAQPEDRQRGLEAGFDVYLTKPLNLGNLISSAMQLLRKGAR